MSVYAPSRSARPPQQADMLPPHASPTSVCVRSSRAASAGSRTLLAAMLLVLAGCAAPLPDDAMRRDLPGSWRHAEAASVKNAMVSHAGERASAAGWWRDFGDPALDAFVQTALDQNADVAAARSRVQAAYALSREAWAALWPSVDLSVLGEREASGRNSYLRFGADLFWPLALPVEREAVSRVSQGRRNAVQADYEAVRATVAAQAVRSWWLRHHAAERLTMLRDAVPSAHRSQADARVQYQLGLLDAAQLADAERDARQWADQLRQAEHALDEAARAMAVLTDRATPEPEWTRLDGLPGQAARVPALGTDGVTASLPTAWLEDRLDVASARAKVLVAAGELGLAQADIYPRLALAGSWIYAQPLVGKGNSQYDSLPLVTPVLNVPIWDWGQRRARMQANEYEMQAAIQTYRKVVLDAYSETETALSQWRLAHEQIDATGAESMSREQIWRALEGSARAGWTDRTQSEAARRAWLSARMAHAHAQLAAQLAYMNLYRGKAVAMHTSAADAAAEDR